MPASDTDWRRRWSELVSVPSLSSPASSHSWSRRLRGQGSSTKSSFLDDWWSTSSEMTILSRSRVQAFVQHQRIALRPYVEESMRQTYRLALLSYRLSCTATTYARDLAEAQLKTMSFVQAMIAVCLGGLLLLLVFLLLARSQSTRRIARLRRGGLMSEKNGAALRIVDDSDERDDFEDEDEDDFDNDVNGQDSAGGAEGGVMKRFRSAFSSSKRRTSKSPAEKLRRRPNSIIRITSSDPRSRLSVHAMQMDLDPLGTQARSASFRSSGSSSDANSSTGSTVTRRRKESGRLSSNAESGTSSPVLGPTTSSHPSTPLSRSVHTAGRAAKQRRLARTSLDQERKRHGDHGLGRRSSVSSDDGRSSLLDSPSSVHSFSSALSGGENLWGSSSFHGGGPLKLASILRREPQFYASLPQLPLLSSNGSARSDDDSSAAAASSATAASSSATSWRHAIPTASASSSSTVQQDSPTRDESAFNVLPPTSTLQARQGRLPPGAGRPSPSPLGTSSPTVRLGTLTPDQMKAIWPDKKPRTVKLREPDWTPYASMHERARERMEKYAELQLLSPSERSDSPMGGIASSSTSEEGSGSSAHLMNDEDEMFWYEKYTRSTAASGRDWDWRKRRARQAAALRRAPSLDSASFAMKPLPSEPEQIGSRSTSMTTNGAKQAVSNRVKTSPRLDVNVNGDGIDFNSAVFPYSSSSNSTADNVGQSPAPGFTPNRRIRSYSDIDRREADKAMNVPGRLSSLKPKGGVRKMLSRRDKNGPASGANSPSARRSSEDRHSPPAAATELASTPDGWTRSLELTTGDGRSITADAALHSRMLDGRDSLRKSTSLANLNPTFTDSAPDLHDVRRPDRLPYERQQVHHRTPPPQRSPLTSADTWTDMQVAWSSADAYGTPPLSPTSTLTPRQSGMRSNSLFATPDAATRNGNRDSAVIPADLANMYGRMMFDDDDNVNSSNSPPNMPLPPLPATVNTSSYHAVPAQNGDRPVRPQRRETEPNTRAAAAVVRQTPSSLPRLSLPSNGATESAIDANVRLSSPSKRAIVANARTASQRRAFANADASVGTPSSS